MESSSEPTTVASSQAPNTTTTILPTSDSPGTSTLMTLSGRNVTDGGNVDDGGDIGDEGDHGDEDHLGNGGDPGAGVGDQPDDQ